MDTFVRININWFPVYSKNGGSPDNKTKGEYDSDDEYEPPAVLHGRESVEREEREREFKEITESATLDDIKEIADILGVAYQVWNINPNNNKF